MVRQGAMGLAAMVSALTCACTSASTGGPPAIAAKPPLTGDAAGYLLISGTGPSENPNSVGRADRTLFARSAPGFMRIDFLRGGGGGGRARLGVITMDRDGNGVEEYSRWLEMEKEVLR